MTVEALSSAASRTSFDPSPARRLRAWARPHRRRLAIATLLTVLDAVPAVGFAAGLAGALASLASGDGPWGVWLALAGASLGLRAVLGQAATSVSVKAAAGVKGDVRGTVLTQIFAGQRPGVDGMAAAVEGAEALDGYFSRFAPLKTAAAIAPLLVIIACAFASPVSAAILVGALIPFVVGMILAGTAAAAESRRQFESLRSLSSLFLDRVRALPVLIAFQAETLTTAEIARAADELQRRTGRVLRVAFLSSAVLEFFAALSVALVAVYCGFNLLRLLPFPAPETLDLGRAVFVLALAPEVYAPLRRLAAAYHDRQAAEAAVPDLVGPASGPFKSSRSGIVWSHAPSLSFQGVGIRYGEGPEVVAGFDLEVPGGSVIALTGTSGSGKSSLLHLLLGLAPLSSGEVMIGGSRLSEVRSFAGAVGWASQAPIVIPGTLDANIALARRDSAPRDILWAAAEAGLNGDLARVLDERGGGLSGGERRRLGLARALLSKSKILLLDEPTANLDAETEARLIVTLRRALVGRTTLIATHSEAVLALADRVVRL
ncbi:MAG: thiol reductant ABC exporter subunit CydD [Brevundimonas sp.]